MMFVYTDLVRQAIEDMVITVSELRHIDPRRLLVIAGPRACRGKYGNLAQCHALREPEKEDLSYWYHTRTRQVVRATPWGRSENTRVVIHGVEMLYVILLRLPRLLQNNVIETLIHELVHIGPNFDGQLRRMRHGENFNAVVERCVRQWKRFGNRTLVRDMQIDYRTLRLCRHALVGLSFGPPFICPRVRPLENPPPIESYPDFRRKQLFCDPLSVEVVEGKWTSPRAPALLTERDLVYRYYTANGARKIASGLVLAQHGKV